MPEVTIKYAGKEWLIDFDWCPGSRGHSQMPAEEPRVEWVNSVKHAETGEDFTELFNDIFSSKLCDTVDRLIVEAFNEQSEEDRRRKRFWGIR